MAHPDDAPMRLSAVAERSAAIRASMPQEAQAVTIEEAAALLRVTERTIKAMRADGRLPRSRALGVARIPLSAIVALLAGGEEQLKRRSSPR